MNKEKNKQDDRIKFLNKLGIITNDKGRVKIDVGVLSKLKPIPSGNHYKSIVVNDAHLMGFRARCNPGGSIAFIYRFRPKGLNAKGKLHDKQHISIGDWYNKNDPTQKDLIGITPAFARKLAEDMKVKIARKEDPWSIVKERKKGKSLLTVHTDFINKRLSSANYKAKTVIDSKSRYKLYIKCDGKSFAHKQLYRAYPAAFAAIKKPIKDLTKDDYVALHTAISTHKLYPANRVIEDLRLVEQYAIEMGYLKKRVVVFKKKELNNEVDRLDREDPYDANEMRRYRVSSLKLIKKDRKNYLVSNMALLGTGLMGGRSQSMIFSIQWDQVNMKSNTIKFLDTKNNKPITLDFDYRFKAILRIMLQYRQTINHRDKRYTYVFPSSSKGFKTKHIRDVRKSHRSITELAQLKHKCIHFLRHSWATNSFEATGDILSVKEMGGWRNLNSVQKYVAVSKNIKQKRLKQMREHMNKRSHVA